MFDRKDDTFPGGGHRSDVGLSTNEDPYKAQIDELLVLWQKEYQPLVFQRAQARLDNPTEPVAIDKRHSAAEKDNQSQAELQESQLDKLQDQPPIEYVGPPKSADLLQRLAPNCDVQLVMIDPSAERPHARYRLCYELMGCQAEAILEEDLTSLRCLGVDGEFREFKLSSWLMSGVIDLVKLVPPNVQVMINAYFKEIEDKSQPASFNVDANLISICSLNATGLMSFAHETGHAWHKVLEPNSINGVKDIKHDLRELDWFISKWMGFDDRHQADELIPDDREKDFLGALRHLHYAERFASEYGLKLLEDISVVLGVARDSRSWQDDYETNWQSYDDYVGPGAGASDKIKSLTEETKRAIWNYYWWAAETRVILGKLLSYHGGSELERVKIADANSNTRLRMNLLDDGVMHITVWSGDESALCSIHPKRFTLSPVNGGTEPLSFDLFDADGLVGAEQILSSERFKSIQDYIRFILEDELDETEKLARRLINNLDESTGGELIQMFDPLQLQKEKLDMSIVDQMKTDVDRPWISRESMDPLKRVQRICDHLAYYFAHDLVVGTEERGTLVFSKYDQITGDEINSAQDRLSAICHLLLVSKGNIQSENLTLFTCPQLVAAAYQLTHR